MKRSPNVVVVSKKVIADDMSRHTGQVGILERTEKPLVQSAVRSTPCADLAVAPRLTSDPVDRIKGIGPIVNIGVEVLMGPWSHSIPTSSTLAEVDFGPRAYRFLNEEDKRWYDYWLKGEENGLYDDPPLHIFVMGENVWRFEREWPLARTAYERWYLHSNGRANSLFGDGYLSPEPPAGQPADRFRYDPERPVPSIGGNNSTQDWSQSAEEPIVPGPVDQRMIGRRDDVLVYTAAPLDRDMEVTGPLEFVLYAATTAKDTDFTVKLIDVFPDGYAMNISEGIIRARYRLDPRNPEPVQPGEVERYTIRMYPTSMLFRKGHRIRVDLSSSNFPRFSRNLNTGEPVATGTTIKVADQTVLHSTDYPSHIVLPVIPR